LIFHLGSGSKEIGQKQGQQSTSCGVHWGQESADYVSAARVVSQMKYSMDFIWKEFVADHKNDSSNLHGQQIFKK
jgi:hypothetical protein